MPQQTSDLLELLKLREQYREDLHFWLNASPDEMPDSPPTFREWFLTLYHYEIEDNK